MSILVTPNGVAHEMQVKAAVQQMRIQIAAGINAQLLAIEYSRAVQERDDYMDKCYADKHGEEASKRLNVNIGIPAEIAVASADLLLVQLGVLTRCENPE